MDSLKRDIERYFEEMRVRLSVVDETKREIDRLIAPDFSLFSILWVDEVRLSSMIASMLDPHGAHGQERKFLDLFLETLMQSNSFDAAQLNLAEIKAAWAISKKIKVELESSTNMISASQRRMDILIHDDNYALMIENKPWAIDQQDQLVDYGIHLEKRFKGKFAMGYLSSDGGAPSKDSFTQDGQNKFDQFVREGKVSMIAFRPHLTDWLTRCLALTEADRVRWIIKDFIAYLESNFAISAFSIEEQP